MRTPFWRRPQFVLALLMGVPGALLAVVLLSWLREPPPQPQPDVALELEKRIADLESAPRDGDLSQSSAASYAAKDYLVKDEPRCSQRRVDFEGAKAHLDSVVARRSIKVLSPTYFTYQPDGFITSTWERMKILQERLDTVYAKECPGMVLGPYHQRASAHVAGTMATLQDTYREKVIPQFKSAPPTIEAAAGELPAIRAKANAEYQAQQASERAAIAVKVQDCTREALRDMPNVSQQSRGEMVQVCENALRK